MTRSRETDPTEFRDTRAYSHPDAILASFSSKKKKQRSSRVLAAGTRATFYRLGWPFRVRFHDKRKTLLTSARASFP